MFKALKKNLWQGVTESDRGVHSKNRYPSYQEVTDQSDAKNALRYAAIAGLPAAGLGRVSGKREGQGALSARCKSASNLGSWGSVLLG